MTYRPLVEFDKHEEILQINSNQLGNFIYKLILNSKKSNNIPTIYFKCKIGDYLNKIFTFTNFLQKQVNYSILVTSLNEGNLKNPKVDFTVPQPTLPSVISPDNKGIS